MRKSQMHPHNIQNSGIYIYSVVVLSEFAELKKKFKGQTFEYMAYLSCERVDKLQPNGLQL